MNTHGKSTTMDTPVVMKAAPARRKAVKTKRAAARKPARKAAKTSKTNKKRR